MERDDEVDIEIERYLLRSVCDFSYDVVASKPNFRENNCVEIMVILFICSVTNQDEDTGLLDIIGYNDFIKFQNEIIAIIKSEILAYKENRQLMNKLFPLLYTLLQDIPKQGINHNLAISKARHNPKALMIPEKVKQSLSARFNLIS